MDQEVTEEVVVEPEVIQEPESTPGIEETRTEEHELVAPEEPEAPADDDAGAHRNKGVNRRIGQLTRRYRQAERENTALQGRLDALEQRVGPVPAPDRPQIDDFETSESFDDATYQWRKDVEAFNTKVPAPQQPVKSPAAIKIEGELEAMLDIHPDAVEAVMDNPWDCNDATYDFIKSSEMGATLAYHLATNQAVASKINAMTPMQAARELVNIEAELSATVNKPSASPAPPPGEPVSPSASSVVTDPDKMSNAQWKVWREADLAKRA